MDVVIYLSALVGYVSVCVTKDTLIPVDCEAGAIVLTWMHNSTKNSLVTVTLWHGAFNFMTASTAETGALPAVLTALVIEWAVIVVRVTKAKYLTSI